LLHRCFLHSRLPYSSCRKGTESLYLLLDGAPGSDLD
jgi:hypothetical protein